MSLNINTELLENEEFYKNLNKRFLVTPDDYIGSPYVNPNYKHRLPELQRGAFDIQKIIIHCTATDSQKWDDAETCINYDLNPNHISRSGCPTCTYHFYVDQDGGVDQLVSAYIKTWNCKGHNNDSIAICINHGGEADDVIEDAQYKALVDTICHVIDFMDWSYNRETLDDVLFFHHDFSNKLCPGVNLDKETLIKDVLNNLQTWGDNV